MKSATEYPGVSSEIGSPVFQFSRMENLLRGHSVRTVAVDGVSAEFVTDPVLVRRILVKDSKNYGKGELFRKARNLSRAGLLTEDESVHRHYRRLTHPYLRTAAVAEYAQVMHEIAREAVTRGASARQWTSRPRCAGSPARLPCAPFSTACLVRRPHFSVSTSPPCPGK